jgi:hypothetical protein
MGRLTGKGAPVIKNEGKSVVLKDKITIQKNKV